jgi:hypothetical protein
MHSTQSPSQFSQHKSYPPNRLRLQIHCKMYEQKWDDFLILGLERGWGCRSVEMKVKKDPCLDTKYMPQDFEALVKQASVPSNGGPPHSGRAQRVVPATPPASSERRKRAV